MKRAKSGKSPSATKRKHVSKDFAEYLASVPQAAKGPLRKMRGVIRSALPGRITETISYGIPAFKSEKGVIIWFAAFSDHCSLFPTAAVIKALKKELKGFSTSKGTIHFSLGKPLPLGLIRNMVKIRLRQMGTKKR